MKYKDYPSKKELCLYIISELNTTLDNMSASDGVHSDNPMFKGPRAKRSELLKKRKEVKSKMKKYGRT
jgi:hypothetical protein